MFEGLVESVADSFDDFLMWMQRIFCRHRPLVLSERVICKKCGKELSHQIPGGKR